MYVFVDDSGDPGFKFNKGSSRFFVIACCVFETAEAAESASAAISALKDRLGRPQHVEFKFAKTRLDTQVQFFDALSREEFFIRVLVIDKVARQQMDRDYESDSLYHVAIHQVLASASPVLSGARVTIDGGGSRNYRKSVAGLIRGELRFSTPGAIRTISFAQSHRDPLLQLADMVAGCARHLAEGDNRTPDKWGLLAGLMRSPRSSIEMSD
jgi:hypothetical protein